jgi:D-alanyl-D-alanine carboxypeptidase (penicillin-binding protein 5/6)
MMLRLLTGLLFALFLPLGAAAQTVPETLAKQAYVVDVATGQVLFDKDGREKMPTSSMSKVLTMYLVFDALKAGKTTLDTEYPVTERAWSTQGSKMFVELGAKIKVEDLIRGVIVQSGNDATIVLAEGLAGSEAEFVVAMNKKAQELGMKNSHFMNASGWPDPDHYSTAEDLAILTNALIKNHPDFYKYYSEKEFTYHNIKQGNRNPLLYKNIGADGVKTGHTEAAGYGLIGSGVVDGRRVIMVVNGLSSMQERADESARLLEWALKSFENVKLFKAGEAVETATVAMGTVKTVPMTLDNDLTFTLPRLGRGDVQAKVTYMSPLVAPVTKGQEIGTLHLALPGMPEATYPLKAGADVPELGFFAGMVEKLHLYVDRWMGGK